jgi:glutamate/tyrosine decarboxylase-like PLP-dependent enzyme
MCLVERQPDDDTLDPEDWEATLAVAQRMVAEAFTYLRTVRERRVWTPMPPVAAVGLQEPLPREGQGIEKAYADFARHVLPYPTGNIHPRFWGWVKGTGTVEGMLAELLAAAMNCNVTGFDDAATRVELQVLDWCKEVFGFPAGASGLLVSGGSEANLLGLAVARHAGAGFDEREQGLSAAPAPLVLYGSEETHLCVTKAVELLGLGRRALRRVPVNERYEIDLAALAQAIEADRLAGLRPFCVVGNVGTVNTGAIDDLAALADLCRREGLWLHVDGAFGAWAALTREPGLVSGIAEADSLAFDMHKWLGVPYGVGATLVRDAAQHRATFEAQADYLGSSLSGPTAGTLAFGSLGFQQSRDFKALKVWMTFKVQGVKKLGRIIERNIAQARHFADLVSGEPELELMAPVRLNVVCFRYAGPVPEAERDAFNRELLARLHLQGLVVPSSTLLSGRFTLRVAITNHRSRMDDFDLLLHEVLRLGHELRQA